METGRTAQDAAALMRDISAGSEAALQQLILLHGRNLTIFAARYLGDPAQAEDVVQEVFIRVWDQAGRYDAGRGAVSTWLYRIAANLCIDRQRRARFRRFLGMRDVGEMADTLRADEPGAEQTQAGREALARVRRGIAGLPDRQRQAILLAAVAGMDTGEIAGIMGTSRGAVEQLLVRARRTLRDLAGGWRPGPGEGDG